MIIVSELVYTVVWDNGDSQRSLVPTREVHGMQHTEGNPRPGMPRSRFEYTILGMN